MRNVLPVLFGILLSASLLFASAAAAQLPPAPAVTVAVNPLTNKVYAADQAANRVVVLDAATGATKSIAVGSAPRFIAVDPLRNRVYVNNAGDASLTVIDGASDTNLTPTPFPIGSEGPIAIDAVSNVVYIVRLTGTGSDEVMFFDAGSSTWYAIATNSFQPISVGVNPLTHTLYVAHYATGDLRVVSGAFDPANDFPATTSIGIGTHPFAVAVNPVTGKVYVISENPGGPIAVVDGATNTAQFPAPAAGHAQGPRAIAVNTVTNVIYAAFANEVIAIDGATNAYTYIPVDTGTGQVSLAVNASTNKVYVASDGGVLTVIDGASNATSTLAIPTGATGLGTNPVTDTAFVYGSSLTAIPAAPGDTQQAIPLTTSIGALAGDASGPDVTFALAAGSGFAPQAPAVEAVYYQLDSTAGAWTQAAGTGPYSATFTGLPGGSHTLHAFAVDSQLAARDTGPQSLPLVGAIASYTFTVSSSASVSLASSLNPSTAGEAVTFTASVSASAGAPTGTVDFRDGSASVAGCSAAPLSAGTASCTTSQLAVGSHSVTARYSGDSTFASATSAALAQTVQSAPSAPHAALSPAALDFGGQSMGTSSPAKDVVLTNTGAATLSVSGISLSDPQFAQTGDCASIAPGASCTIRVTFTPAPVAGAVDSTDPVSATLSIASDDPASPATASLAGTAEKSLVTHFYLSILARAPDAGGKAFWQDEAARMVGLGANVNEAWYAMAAAFFASAEYAALGRDDAGFVTDLYETFFNRAPDASGLSFWTGELANGMPRGVVLVSFMFSPEFASFTQSVFGDAAARAEVDVVGDFYRGLLARLPDSSGFGFWVGQFRTAQCQGAGAVRVQAQAISSSFADGSEYANRARTDAEYVGDLYNAFLRRGGDSQGVQFWIRQLASGAQTRDQIRDAFIGTPEFTNRVNAIVAQGCVQ